MSERTSLTSIKLEAGVNPVDVAIGQMLDLARAANIAFDVVDGRLIMRASRADWRLWPPVRACLDQIGVEAIVEYFERTTPEDRALLSAAA